MDSDEQLVKLRRAEATDAAAIAEIHLGARRRHLAFAPLVHTDAEVRTWIREQVVPAGMTWVLVENPSIVAYVTLEARSDGGWIGQLYTHPDSTGRGYGTILLTWAKRALPAPIRLYTFQQNERARRFYERAGFVVEKLSDGLTNEEKCPDVLYRWPA